MSTVQKQARLRGGGISLLIGAQLLLLDIVTRLAVREMLRGLAIPPSWWTRAIRIAVDMILLVCLWLYYDSIDDRGFADFCQSNNDRPLWDMPAHGTGLTVATVGIAPLLSFPVYDLLAGFSLPRVPAALLASVTAVGFTVGGRVLILMRLRNIWVIQKELRTGKEKRHHPVSRILYALVFCISLGLAVWVVIGVAGDQVIKIGGVLMDVPLKALAGLVIVVLFGWMIDLLFRIGSRRRFLARLGKLSREGSITFAVEGHPYLSLLSSHIYAGLTVIHRTKCGNLNRQTVYCVGLVNGKSRRNILILCQNQVYRFLHRLPNQPLIRRLGTEGMMFYRPMYSWYESHAFDFPEGQGTRILLLDPFPAVLAMEDQVADWFYDLDIGSHAFGYTVHSRNSFLHALERS